MVKSCFRFLTLYEARTLATYIANCFPEPERTIYGLHELLINAVEHGNLGITCPEKTKPIFNNGWKEEVQRRLGLAENLTNLIDPHGRGIATSRMMSFHDLQYLASGNEVRRTVHLIGRECQAL